MSQENLEAENTYSGESWVRIGNLKGIYIYPLDTGRGYKISEAFCAMDGLQSWSLRENDDEENDANDDKMRYYDRTFVPIEPYVGKLLSNSLVANMDINEKQFQEMQENANRIISGKWQPWRSKFNYLEEEMIANDIGFDITHPYSGYLGEADFIPQEERNDFITQARRKFDVNDDRKFISNFYAYTMINITSLDSSLDELLEENYKCDEIPIEKFRPHFVIETNEEYLLDRVVELKIGDKVRFSNIVPCTHHFEERVYQEPFKEPEDLHNFFKTYRSLNWLHPELYKSKMTAFGINLEIKTPGKISLYDDILVKFKKHEVKVFDI